jgi:thymidylate kinase
MQPHEGSLLKLSEPVERYMQAGEERPALDLVRRLCETLNREGIAYCHWKSTAALDRSARGDNDLDLLVSRSDALRFTEILCRHGFKETIGPTDLQLPGVLSYYGFDQPAGRFVHVHAHYQLVMGHDMTKNTHLPLEQAYLASAVQKGLFKIPAPEFELLLLVIRMVIKHSTWDTILTGQGALSPSEKQELSNLQAVSDRAQIDYLLKEYLPFVDLMLFDDCSRSLQPGCPIWKRIRPANKLQNRLKIYGRRSGIPDLFLKQWRRLVLSLRRRVLRHNPKIHLAGGGAIIAIVGGDGAGKTTVVNELYAWLSKKFDVSRVHMGKPPWSLTTIAIRGILKIGRSLGLYPFMRTSLEDTLDPNSNIFPGYPWLVREVCTARDRYLTYVKARRYASNGRIVICDRFPLSQVKLMDGPQLERMAREVKKNRLIKFLTRLESSYYQQIMLPELLIVLRLDPETAVIRKSDEAEVSVRARSAEIWGLDWRETPAYVIDTNRTKEEVFSSLKSLLWEQL